MSVLSFLKASNVTEVTATAKSTRGGAAKQWQPNPSIVAIRLWRDGAVFPSTAAIDKFDLEYKDVTITKEEIPMKSGETVQKHKNVYAFPNGTGNGLDVIDSRLWGQLNTEAEGGMLFTIPTPKNQPKVDLFGTANYDDKTGKPLLSVTEQGAKTFGTSVLIPAVEKLYGITFKVDVREAVEAKAATASEPAIEAKPAVQGVEGVEYVDLAIVEDLGRPGTDEYFNIVDTYSKNILNIPKRIIRGKDAGKPDYIRRENSKVYGLVLASEVIEDYGKEDYKEVDNTAELADALK